MNIPTIGGTPSEKGSFRGIMNILTPVLSSTHIKAPKQSPKHGISGFGERTFTNNSRLAIRGSFDSLPGEPENLDEELVIENKLKDL